MLEINCKEFSQSTAGTIEKLSGSKRAAFWWHWLICSICRNYWKQIQLLGKLQKAYCKLKSSQVSQIKKRLKGKLLSK